KGLALATLLLDGGKGAFVVLVAKAMLGADATLIALIAGFGAVLGHNFPVWLKGKGGKGVATTMGVMLAAAPGVGAVGIVTWGLMAVLFRISSLAALVALAVAPLYAFTRGYQVEAIVFTFLGILGWCRHRQNIQRLLKGEAPRLGATS